MEDLASLFGIEEVSGPVNYFHSLIEQEDELWEQYKCLSNDDQIRVLLDRIHDLHSSYPAHGIDHTYNIIENLGNIFREVSDPNAYEAFILACSAWLHDIGMSIQTKIEIREPKKVRQDWKEYVATKELDGSDQDKIENDQIRKWHHILSWELIRRPSGPVSHCIDEELRDLIAQVSKYHRRQTDTSELDQRVTISGKRQTNVNIHLRKIAALFQIADALDLDRRRIEEALIENRWFNSESTKHWLACDKISNFTIDSDEDEILLNAHTNSNRPRNTFSDYTDEDLIRFKAKHLYSEIFQVRDILANSPYEFSIDSIRVRAQDRFEETPYTYYGEIEYLEELENEKPDKIDVQAHYEVCYVQEDGDFKNLKLFHCIPESSTGEDGETDSDNDNGGVITRPHSVKCNESGMHWIWSDQQDIFSSLLLEEDGDISEYPVAVEPKVDHDDNKHFLVKIRPGDFELEPEFRYKLFFKWDNFFRSGSDNLGHKTHSNSLTLFYVLPDGVDFEILNSEESLQNRTRELAVRDELEYLEGVSSLGDLEEWFGTYIQRMNEIEFEGCDVYKWDGNVRGASKEGPSQVDVEWRADI